MILYAHFNMCLPPEGDLGTSGCCGIAVVDTWGIYILWWLPQTIFGVTVIILDTPHTYESFRGSGECSGAPQPALGPDVKICIHFGHYKKRHDYIYMKALISKPGDTYNL